MTKYETLSLLYVAISIWTLWHLKYTEGWDMFFTTLFGLAFLGLAALSLSLG